MIAFIKDTEESFSAKCDIFCRGRVSLQGAKRTRSGQGGIKTEEYAKKYLGIPKGGARNLLEEHIFVAPPFGRLGESENHTGGSRRFFAYFLTGEKV